VSDPQRDQQVTIVGVHPVTQEQTSSNLPHDAVPMNSGRASFSNQSPLVIGNQNGFSRTFGEGEQALLCPTARASFQEASRTRARSS
jgi:hypothetical protein